MCKFSQQCNKIIYWYSSHYCLSCAPMLSLSLFLTHYLSYYLCVIGFVVPHKQKERENIHTAFASGIDKRLHENWNNSYCYFGQISHEHYPLFFLLFHFTSFHFISLKYEYKQIKSPQSNKWYLWIDKLHSKLQISRVQAQQHTHFASNGIGKWQTAEKYC